MNAVEPPAAAAILRSYAPKVPVKHNVKRRYRNAITNATITLSISTTVAAVINSVIQTRSITVPMSLAAIPHAKRQHAIPVIMFMKVSASRILSTTVESMTTTAQPQSLAGKLVPVNPETAAQPNAKRTSTSRRLESVNLIPIHAVVPHASAVNPGKHAKMGHAATIVQKQWLNAFLLASIQTQI